eukprot:479388_1
MALTEDETICLLCIVVVGLVAVVVGLVAVVAALGIISGILAPLGILVATFVRQKRNKCTSGALAFCIVCVLVCNTILLIAILDAVISEDHCCSSLDLLVYVSPISQYIVVFFMEGVWCRALMTGIDKTKHFRNSGSMNMIFGGLMCLVTILSTVTLVGCYFAAKHTHTSEMMAIYSLMSLVMTVLMGHDCCHLKIEENVKKSERHIDKRQGTIAEK